MKGAASKARPTNVKLPNASSLRDGQSTVRPDDFNPDPLRPEGKMKGSQVFSSWPVQRRRQGVHHPQLLVSDVKRENRERRTWRYERENKTTEKKRANPKMLIRFYNNI
jgi:hypothetical protein